LAGLPTLTWLRAFEAAARTSSFSAAALELRLTPGAISYQIRALEAHLGFALFERLPRGVKLTPMGVAYLPPVRKAFEQLADSTVGLFGGSERGEISIHAPVSLASLWLAPKLPAFSRAFPGIDVRLSSVIWDHPAPTESTDLEIRYGAGQWRGYRSEFLCNQRIVAVCNRELLEQARASGDAAAWLLHHLIPAGASGARARRGRRAPWAIGRHHHCGARARGERRRLRACPSSVLECLSCDRSAGGRAPA
jgi:LysR family glycine cleavage system transcriptional activator